MCFLQQAPSGDRCSAKKIHSNTVDSIVDTMRVWQEIRRLFFFIFRFIVLNLHLKVLSSLSFWLSIRKSQKLRYIYTCICDSAARCFETLSVFRSDIIYYRSISKQLFKTAYIAEDLRVKIYPTAIKLRSNEVFLGVSRLKTFVQWIRWHRERVTCEKTMRQTKGERS